MQSGLVKNKVQFVVRQRGTVALFALIFAIGQAVRVAAALWHGVSLHGDYVEPSPGKPYTVLMPVWDTFVQAVTAAVVGCALLLSSVREQKRARSNTRCIRRHTASTRRH